MTHTEAATIELDRLSPREKEALIYACKGFTCHEIAGLMGITKYSAMHHQRSVATKLGNISRMEMAVLAAKAGWV